MKHLFKKICFLFIFAFLLPNFVFAYVSLVPDSPLGAVANSLDLYSFLKTLYDWGVGIAVALSILFIIFGGIQYMTTDSIFGKKGGKDRIVAALTGLLIALSSWLILNQINPGIFKNNLTLTGLGNLNTTPLESGTPTNTTIPDYIGTEEFVESGDPYNPTLTAYSPQKSGGLIGMEGGYESSRPGLDGKSIVRTLDDYSSGKSSYVTLAGDASQYGKAYTIPTITYKNNLGQTKTLYNVKGYVHDTGSAFKGAGSSKFDVPIGRDYTNNQMNTQPFGGNKTSVVPSDIKK